MKYLKMGSLGKLKNRTEQDPGDEKRRREDLKRN